MSYPWFRLHQDLRGDPKLTAIARKCGVPRAHVVAVWIECLFCGNENPNRGSLDNWNADEVMVSTDLDIDEIERIYKGFVDRDMIFDGCLANWNKRQANYDSSTERTRAYRQRQKGAKDGAPPPGPPPGNALDKAFDDFMAAFPDRAPHSNPRGEAKKKFMVIMQGNGAPTPDFIVGAAHTYREQIDLRREDDGFDAKYILQAKTWLNKGMWIDDDPAPPEESAGDQPASRYTAELEAWHDGGRQGPKPLRENYGKEAANGY
jgi:hypothetical protein